MSSLKPFYHIDDVNFIPPTIYLWSSLYKDDLIKQKILLDNNYCNKDNNSYNKDANIQLTQKRKRHNKDIHRDRDVYLYKYIYIYDAY